MSANTTIVGPGAAGSAGEMNFLPIAGIPDINVAFRAYVLYILVIATWTMGIMYPFFTILYRSGIMRVPPEAEAAGLDVSYHGGSSYPGHREDGGMEEAGTNFYTRGSTGGSDGNEMQNTRDKNRLLKTDSEEQLLMMNLAVEEALKEVEKRGWQPPITGKMVQEDIGASNVGDEITMQPSQRLADIRAAVQQSYKRNSSPTPADAGATGPPPP